ncbi:hypothetical protein ASC80_14895 [Afipia sp. Root123D2]|nr:hypothetical protein ASC80_14895 [Afipia sp. Root123D2]
MGISLRAAETTYPFFERRFVAVPGPRPATGRAEHEFFWTLMLRETRDSMPWDVKDSSTPWDTLGMNISKGLTAEIVHGREIDDDTHRAVQSALLYVYNTSTHKADLSVAAFALACFINAHPAFKAMSNGIDFNELHGASTAYQLMDVTKLLEEHGAYG